MSNTISLPQRLNSRSWMYRMTTEDDKYNFLQLVLQTTCRLPLYSQSVNKSVDLLAFWDSSQESLRITDSSTLPDDKLNGRAVEIPLMWMIKLVTQFYAKKSSDVPMPPPVEAVWPVDEINDLTNFNTFDFRLAKDVCEEWNSGFGNETVSVFECRIPQGIVFTVAKKQAVIERRVLSEDSRDNAVAMQEVTLGYLRKHIQHGVLSGIVGVSDEDRELVLQRIQNEGLKEIEVSNVEYVSDKSYLNISFESGLVARVDMPFSGEHRAKTGLNLIGSVVDLSANFLTACIHGQEKSLEDRLSHLYRLVSYVINNMLIDTREKAAENAAQASEHTGDKVEAVLACKGSFRLEYTHRDPSTMWLSRTGLAEAERIFEEEKVKFGKDRVSLETSQPDKYVLRNSKNSFIKSADFLIENCEETTQKIL